MCAHLSIGVCALCDESHYKKCLEPEREDPKLANTHDLYHTQGNKKFNNRFSLRGNERKKMRNRAFVKIMRFLGGWGGILESAEKNNFEVNNDIDSELKKS